MAIVLTWASVGVGIAIVVGLALLGLKHRLAAFDRRHGFYGDDVSLAPNKAGLPARCPYCGQLNLPRCPRCGSENIYSIFRPWQFHCRRCGFDGLDDAMEAKAIMEGLIPHNPREDSDRIQKP